MSWGWGTRVTEKWSAVIHHFLQPIQGITSPNLIFHPSQLRSKLVGFVAIDSNEVLQDRVVGAKTRVCVLVGGVKPLCGGFRKVQ